MPSLFRSLIANTFILSSGQVIVGLLGLISVSILIQSYGLYEYGLILLARVVLPNSLLAIIDLGAIENASQAVARAREGREDLKTSNELSLLVVCSFIVGVIAAGFINIFSEQIVSILNVEDGYKLSFIFAIIISASLLPLLYPLQISEGVLRGYEKYAIIKVIDVMASIVFVVGIWLFVNTEKSYISVIYLYLAVYSAKLVIFSAYAYLFVTDKVFSLRLASISLKDSEDMVARIKLMTKNRILATMLNHLPAVAISALLSPASVSVYETLIRIPRFLKALVGLTSSAVYSLSARLYERNDEETVRLLSRMGIRFIAMIAFPVFICCSLFAKEILYFWIGGEIVAYWPLLSILFVVPLISSLQFFIVQSNVVKKEFLSNINRIALLQVVVFWLLVIFLLNIYEIEAFIFANIMGVIVAFSAVLTMYTKNYPWMKKILIDTVYKQLVIAACMLFVMIAIKMNISTENILLLLGMITIWLLGYLVLTVLIFISKEDKEYIVKIVDMIKPNRIK